MNSVTKHNPVLQGATCTVLLNSYCRSQYKMFTLRIQYIYKEKWHGLPFWKVARCSICLSLAFNLQLDTTNFKVMHDFTSSKRWIFRPTDNFLFHHQSHNNCFQREAFRYICQEWQHETTKVSGQRKTVHGVTSSAEWQVVKVPPIGNVR